MKQIGYDEMAVKKKLDAGAFTNETTCYKLLALQMARNSPKLSR